MTTTYYVTASLDGFIARLDGDVSWLLGGGDEDDDYQRFLEDVDTLVMGRKTYEVVRQVSESWPYPGKRTLVASRNPNFRPETPGCEVVADIEAAILRERESSGHWWIVGGGDLASALLGVGLLDEVRLFIQPRILGGGIPAFRPEHEKALRLTEVRQFQQGLVGLSYRVGD